MRIVRIAVHNLASLRGDQPEVILDGEAYGEAGLIAITGPTGAGKSTLFDAVCLPLFDRTPRLDDPRDLLSRGCGQGWAEVDLVLDDGRRIRARWSVHRARLRADERLQQADCEVLDEHGSHLATGKRDVRHWIHDHLGLTFDQFRAVVMLSQGDFARFLHEDAKAKAELLERLTGTAYYSHLGRAAHERAVAWLARIDEAQQALDRTVLLDESQRGERLDAIADLDRRRNDLDRELARLDRHLTWWADLISAQDQVAAAAAAMTAAEAAWTAAAERRTRWEIARAAAAFAPALARVDRAQDDLVRVGAEVSAATAAADEAVAVATRARQTLAARLADLDGLGHAIAAARAEDPAIPTIADTDWVGLADARAAVDRAQHQAQDAAAAARHATDQVQTSRTVAAQATTAVEARRRAVDTAMAAATDARTRLQRARADGDLAALLGLDQAWTRALALVDAETTAARGDLFRRRAEAEEAATAATALADQRRQALRQAEDLLDVAQTLLARERHAQDLAAFAGDLHPGEACPLCGSTDHPAPLDGGTVANLIAQSETKVRSLLRLRDETRTAETAAQDALIQARQAAATARARSDEAETQHQQRLAEWAALGDRLADLGDLAATDRTAIARRHADLRARIDDLRQAESAVAEAERSLATGERALADAQAAAADVAGRLAERQDHAARAEEDAARTRQIHLEAETTLTEMVDALRRRLGDDAVTDLPAWIADLDRRRRRANDLQDLDRAWTQVSDDLAAPCRGRIAAGAIPPPTTPTADRTTLVRLREALQADAQADQAADAQRERRLDRLRAAETAHRSCADAAAQAQADLAQALAGSAFADLAALRAALLPPAEIDALAADLRAVDDRRAQAHGRRAAAQDRLDQVLAQADALGLTPASSPLADAAERRGELQVRRGDLLRQRDAHLAEAARLREQLAKDDAARAGHADALRGLDHLRREAQPWLELKDLIGNHDGSAFRLIAQALTLDQLLVLADRRLERIAPRYRLERAVTDNDPWSLAIQVIDLDQAGERRPVATLSGGETFLVSLALALALADLRRGHHRIDTLFIDEGLAALDATSLDQALTVLETLQAEQGMQILVISHVGALEERIRHRIHLERLGSGRSRLRRFTPEGELPGGDPPAPLRADAEALADAIAAVGGSAGIGDLRKVLAWDKDRFDTARDLLVEGGRVDGVRKLTLRQQTGDGKWETGATH